MSHCPPPTSPSSCSSPSSLTPKYNNYKQWPIIYAPIQRKGARLRPIAFVVCYQLFPIFVVIGKITIVNLS